jgi:hypothetical protein
MSSDSPKRRSFFGWIGDVVCGLSAYTLSRWIWQKHGVSVFSNLLEELGTFAILYVLLKLSLKAIGVARRNAKAAKALAPKK